MQRALLQRATSLALPTLRLTTARYSTTSAPASVVDRTFWRSLIPKPLRKENRKALRAHYGKGWNPATFFIVIFLLIGSMSIQMIALRKSFDRYMRTSEVKIALLREVVEKIQNGEEVDVEKVLGTGDPQKEADWEEVLRSIEQGDVADQEPAEQQQSEQPNGDVQPEETAVEEVEKPVEVPSTKKPASGLGSFF